MSNLLIYSNQGMHLFSVFVMHFFILLYLKDPLFVSSSVTRSHSSTTSISTDTSTTTSIDGVHAEASDKTLSSLHDRPFPSALINHVDMSRPFPLKLDGNLSQTSLPAGSSTSSGIPGRSCSPPQAALSSFATRCPPASMSMISRRENPLSQPTYDVSQPIVSKEIINTAAANDPSVIATGIYIPSQEVLSTMQTPRQVILKRLLAKPAPSSIYFNPPVRYAGYTSRRGGDTMVANLHDNSRGEQSFSNSRQQSSEITTTTGMKNEYVNNEYQKERTTLGKQDDAISILSSGDIPVTNVNSPVLPVTTHDRQTKSSRSKLWEEDALLTRHNGVSPCDDTIEIEPESSLVHSSMSIPPNENGMKRPGIDKTLVNYRGKTQRRNVLRRTRSVGGNLRTALKFTELPSAGQLDDFKDSSRASPSVIRSYTCDSKDVHKVSISAADTSSGIHDSKSLPIPTYTPLTGFAHQHPKMPQSCDERVPFRCNNSKPASAVNEDVAVSHNLNEEEGSWTLLQQADGEYINTNGTGEISGRRRQRSAALSESARILPSFNRKKWDEDQKRVGHHRNDSKWEKVQKSAQILLLPLRGTDEESGEGETLESPTALQFSKRQDAGYVLAVSRSGDSSDDGGYLDKVGHGTSIIQMRSIMKRRKGVMSGHDHASGSASDKPKEKLDMNLWARNHKGVARATRRSDKRPLKPLNNEERDGLTKDAGKPSRYRSKCWWGLMRKFRAAIKKDKRLKSSPSMPSLPSWSQSTYAPKPFALSERLDLRSGSRMTTQSSSPISSSDHLIPSIRYHSSPSSVSDLPLVPIYPAGSSLQRRIVNPNEFEKAYSQEEGKSGSNSQLQVQELHVPFLPPSPSTPREGDWVRSQSPDIELISLPLPPRKASKQVCTAAHSFASMGENDINRPGSPIIPNFSTSEAINTFPSSPILTMSLKTSSTQANIDASQVVSPRDPPSSTLPPVVLINALSTPPPRPVKNPHRYVQAERLHSHDVDVAEPQHRRRSKSMGTESNMSLSPSMRSPENSSESTKLSPHMKFVRSPTVLPFSTIIRPGTANTFGGAGMRSGMRDSVASEMTVTRGT